MLCEYPVCDIKFLHVFSDVWTSRLKGVAGGSQTRPNRLSAQTGLTLWSSCCTGSSVNPAGPRTIRLACLPPRSQLPACVNHSREHYHSGRSVPFKQLSPIFFNSLCCLYLGNFLLYISWKPRLLSESSSWSRSQTESWRPHKVSSFWLHSPLPTCQNRLQCIMFLDSTAHRQVFGSRLF